MNTNKKTARTAGVLFILATAAGLAGSAVLGTALDGPDFLSRISMDGNRLLVSALLSFVAACASAGIAIALYPVLRKYNEGLALGSVGFRLIEGVFYTVGTICLVSLLRPQPAVCGCEWASGSLRSDDRPSAAHGQGPGGLRLWCDGLLHRRGLVLLRVLPIQPDPALVVGVGARCDPAALFGRAHYPV